MKKNIFLAAFMIMLQILFSTGRVVAQNSKVTAIDKLVNTISIDEKIALIVGAQEIVFANASQGVGTFRLPNKASRPDSATAFPMPLTMASTWNKSLVEKAGNAIGKEALLKGVDVLLTPALNVIRNPLSGNNIEYFSEDPLLVSEMAMALIKGIEASGVGVGVKYFALNNQETNKENLNIIIDNRTLREFYLKTFEKIVKEAKPLCVLVGHPRINGTYMTEDSNLLEGILRGEWNYKGLIVADNFAGKDLVLQVKSGIDMFTPGTVEQFNALKNAVMEGSLSEEDINKHYKIILESLAKTPTYQHLKYSIINRKAHNDLAYQLAAEGCVLLKNVDETLPVDVSKIKKIAFYGVSSYHFCQSAMGENHVQSYVNKSIAQVFMEAGLIPEPNSAGVYNKYLKNFLPPEKEKITKKPSAKTPKNPVDSKSSSVNKPTITRKPPVNSAQIMAKDLNRIASYPFQNQPEEIVLSKSVMQNHVKTSQLAIITIGRVNSVGKERSLQGDYHLRESEINLIKDVCAVYHAWGKRVIVILNVDGMVDMSVWQEYPDAIILSGLAGQAGPQALFDIISGKVNPSGKLAILYPRDYSSIPSSTGFPTSYEEGKNMEKVTYSEKMDIGYRHYDKNQMKVLYPFGYGLSYTTFFYENMQVDRINNSEIFVTLKVTNTGKMAGKEVVQLYVSPKRKGFIIKRPLKVLVDFEKTRLLKPQESQVIKFHFTDRDLAVFDETKNCWITYGGIYTLKVGHSSWNIRLQYPMQLSENKIYPLK